VKQSISAPVAIGIVLIVVVVVAVLGWRFMNAGSRDKNGHDLSAPAVQPSNMGEMMRSRMNAAHGAGRPGGTVSKGPGGAGR
jgi:hypothetical protein